MSCFVDRVQAGRQLAGALVDAYARRDDVIVLALPRGGLPVGREVARALAAPLDVMLVRKLGVPGHEELAMGAVASGGTLLLDRNLIHSLDISQEQVDFVIGHERKELERRERLYRGAKPEPELKGRTLIVVDDGLATGSTMKAAVEALRHHEPAKIVVAVPVGPAETCEALEQVADEVICLISPSPFYAIGPYYGRFNQLTDADVLRSLDEAAREWEHFHAAAHMH